MTNRITIIPAIYGKLTFDGKISEPEQDADLYEYWKAESRYRNTE